MRGSSVVMQRNVDGHGIYLEEIACVDQSALRVRGAKADYCEKERRESEHPWRASEGVRRSTCWSDMRCGRIFLPE